MFVLRFNSKKQREKIIEISINNKKEDQPIICTLYLTSLQTTACLQYIGALHDRR